jgi:hypothetical protein
LNRPYSAHTQKLHRERLEGRGRSFDYAKYERRKYWQMRCEALRLGRVTDAPFGQVRLPQLLTWDEVASMYLDGIPVPLDLMPSTYWREEGSQFPRFGEEALGDAF